MFGAGEICVLCVVSALFSRSVILVSLTAAGLALLQERKYKYSAVLPPYSYLLQYVANI